MKNEAKLRAQPTEPNLSILMLRSVPTKFAAWAELSCAQRIQVELRYLHVIEDLLKGSRQDNAISAESGLLELMLHRLVVKVG